MDPHSSKTHVVQWSTVIQKNFSMMVCLTDQDFHFLNIKHNLLLETSLWKGRHATSCYNKVAGLPTLQSYYARFNCSPLYNAAVICYMGFMINLCFYKNSEVISSYWFKFLFSLRQQKWHTFTTKYLPFVRNWKQKQINRSLTEKKKNPKANGNNGT